MSDQDDEPPPLEDMTEELARAYSTGGPLPRVKSVTSSQRPKGTVSHISKGPTREATSKLKSDTKVSSESSKNKPIVENEGFCGFQKGFLFGSKSSKPISRTSQGKSEKSTRTEDNIIRPKPTGQKSELVFPEVQEAMKETNPLIASDKWLTDDLLSKVEENPILSEGLRDPNMMHYLNLLQTNPKQAMAATKGNPKLQMFMESFCALMGNHLSTLEESSSENTATSELAIMSEEEAKVKKLTSNLEVRTVLLDPQIVKLMQLLKTDPQAAQRFLAESRSADFNSKIQILLKNGLLSLQ